VPVSDMRPAKCGAFQTKVTNMHHLKPAGGTPLYMGTPSTLRSCGLRGAHSDSVQV
jgi:hypothetical protein